MEAKPHKPMPDKNSTDKIRDKTEKPQVDDFYPNISNTVSANDFTGIMYSPPHNDDELDSYEELFNIRNFE